MKTSTKLGLVAVSLVLIASVLVTAVNAQSDNPYSFHWWYKNQYKVYDTDDNDDDNKKHHNKHISKLDNGYRGERLDKRYCAGSGFWDGHKCIIDDPVEKAAYEDAVCDDPKDTNKYKDVCNGDSYAVEEKPKHHEEKSNEDTTTVSSVKPLVIEQSYETPEYKESKFSQDIGDDDPTTEEYKEKVLKHASEMSQEQKEQSEEKSFYDEDYDRSNDGHNDDSNDNDDDNKDTDNNDSDNGDSDSSDDDDESDDNNDNEGSSD